MSNLELKKANQLAAIDILIHNPEITKKELAEERGDVSGASMPRLKKPKSACMRRATKRYPKINKVQQKTPRQHRGALPFCWPFWEALQSEQKH